jgi:protein CSF1
MGRAIRHFMIVRDNYFGGFTNFSTRAEYITKKEINEVGDPIKLKYRPGKVRIMLLVGLRSF